jgi:acyl-CoA synthetase (AMP-forming)/AMP-acid ligase II
VPKDSTITSADLVADQAFMGVTDNIMATIIQSIKNSLGRRAPEWRFPAENLTLTLAQLDQQADRYARLLMGLGIRVGDRIGLVLNNGSDYVAMLMAVWRLNAIAVPLRPRGSKNTQSDQYFQNCDRVCEFSLIIYGDEGITAPSIEWLTESSIFVLSLESFKALPADLTEVAFDSPSRDDIAILQFSSGSTGQPKAVIVTHGMVMVQLKNIDVNHASFRGNVSTVSCASWMPMNHDLGLFIGVLLPLYTGCDNLLAPPGFYMRNPARWFELLAQYRVDLSFTTNSALSTTLNSIRRSLGQAPPDLSRLHLYLSAEKVSPVMLRRCYDLFPSVGLPVANLHVGYGMAESALGCACTRNATLRMMRFVVTPDQRLIPVSENLPDSVELVSVGIADNGHQITIRDSADRILPELFLGEINVEGPCVTPGYYNNPGKTHEAIIGKRLRTGDLGLISDGIIYFYSRKDDMITIGGRNLIPDDIEQSAEELFFVRPTGTCLVATENTATGNAELVLLVEGNHFSEADTLGKQAASIQSQVFRAMEVLLTRIVFCKKGEIEKTSSGKKRRKVMRSRLVNNQIETLRFDHECHA